jgi:hypothetical protein
MLVTEALVRTSADLYIWTDFHFEYETTARLSFHCLIFAHEGKGSCGIGEFLKESFVMPDESTGRITHCFIFLQAQDSGILQAFVLILFSNIKGLVR